MKKPILGYCLIFSVVIAATLTLIPGVGKAEKDPMKLPPARKIPGLTMEDKFPKGCVDCHINMPDINQDERISTLMSRWYKNAGAKLLDKAKAVTQSGIGLKGIHPPASESLKDIPAACIACHSEKDSKAPPLVPLLHSIHLTGGEDNHFLTIFQGECTHCHKMDPGKGIWSTPSNPER